LGARTEVNNSDSGEGSIGIEATPRSGGTRAPASEAARKRVAIELLARHEAALRRTARRYSLCVEDADDAYQQALEILLTKAPTDDLRELIRWTHTVTKHEALAVRRNRERMLGTPAVVPGEDREEPQDWVELLPAEVAGPAERFERREAIARSREALQTLKPQELRALTLLAEGYSYAEIGEITGFSQTKVNRCLAEGRERFRSLVSRSEDGRRCAELGPLLSAFCDGEAGAAEVATLREHLRACAGCRSTLRAYRAAPPAAAALAPTLGPASRSLLDRAHEAFASLSSRLPGQGGTTDSALSQVAAAGGTRGAGMAALAKVLAICAGTAGGAVACVAAGVVPAPFDLEPDHTKKPAIERSAGRAPGARASAVDYEPAPAEAAPEAQPKPQKPRSEPKPAPAPEAPPSEGAVEYTPEAAAPAVAAPSSASASSSTSPAGEFGP
jgi:RNA polymerase sigma factor (sigma-70 family)